MRIHARSAAPLALLTAAVVAASVALTGPALAAPGSTVFINEIHYDNTGTDAGEAIEIAAPAGTDLTGWSLVLYNGAPGSTFGPYDTDPVGGVVPGTPGTYGVVVVTYPTNGIQNGAPDGIALVRPDGTTVEQFLSYEGVITATNGPASGLTSTDIGVAEAGSEPLGQSLALTGSGSTYGDFTWSAPATSSFGAVNPGQAFGPAPDSAPAVTSTSPANAATEVLVDASVTVTFSEPVDVTAGAFTLSCTDTGAHAVTVTGGPTTFTLNPEADFGTSETCTLTVVAAAVTDQDADDPPDNPAADFVSTFTTVGPGGVICSVLPAVTPIHNVQGTTDITPCATKVVTIEGVVVGDYEGASPTLGGFYVQEQDAEVDADPVTSEGVFVFSRGIVGDLVDLGEVVSVTGTAGEFQGQTQITATSVTVGEGGQSVTAAPVNLPVASADFLERHEGMLAALPQELTVTEIFQLGRFGEIVVSSGGRLPQPTNVVEPGAPAQSLQAANNLNRLKIDDATNAQNVDPILFGRGGEPLTAENTLRGGDTVTGAVGVMTYTFGGSSTSSPNAYRLRVVDDLSDTGLVPGGEVPEFAASNPRPPSPPDVGGSMQVGAFNVLNFFLTLDVAGNMCGPTAELECRGANSAEEFQRQRTKLLSALLKLDADVLGLIELENSTGVEPLADIVAGLNEVAGAGTYAFIETGTIGTDAIKVGMIYKTASVTPLDEEVILDKSIDPRFNSDNMRPSMAQSFTETATGEVFTVVVNHLKSKSCGSDAVGLDADLGDGQACFNETRRLGAQALRDWIATQPTGIQDDDYLLVGDFNAYAKEDPIDVLVDAGYVDLVAKYVGEDAYSFVFDAQWGYLDYALASPSLVPQVNDADEYHINSDEPGILDYNTEFKTPAQVNYLFAPNEYRTSDHDPVLVGLALDGLPGFSVTASPNRLWPPNHKYQRVNVTAQTGDGQPLTVTILSVTSSEPDCGGDFGEFCNDIVLVDGDSVDLRSERYSRSGRTYTLDVVITDGAQTVFETLTVRVANK